MYFMSTACGCPQWERGVWLMWTEGSPTTGSLIDFTHALGPRVMYGRDEGQAKVLTLYVYILHDGHLTLSYIRPRQIHTHLCIRVTLKNELP